MRGEVHDGIREQAGDPAAGAFRERLRRALPIALPVGGFALAVTVLAAVLDLEAALSTVARADLRWLAAAAGLALLLTLVSALRLSLILRAAGERRPLRRCWSAVMASLTLNAVTPGRGGDLIKGIFLIDQQGQLGKLLGATLLERIIDVLTLCALAMTGALALKLYGHALIAGLVSFGCLAALASLRFSHRIPMLGRKLETLGHATRAIFARPVYLLAAVGVAGLFWLTVLSLFRCLLLAVAAQVPFGAVAAATPLAILVGILPLSISGIGTRDAALVLLLRDFAPPEAALAAGLLYTAIGVWFLALIGLVGLGRETLRTVRAAASRNQQPLGPISGLPRPR